MKKFKHIIASALAFMLLVTLLVPSMSVSAATNYVFELGLDNIKDEVYEFMAYDIANNQLIELEAQSKATWSPDWPGHFVVGHPDIYVIGKSERNGIVDMLPRTSDQLAPAIVFTAPKAGKYNVIAEFDKLYGETTSGTSFVDIVIVKVATGEIVMTEAKAAHGEVKWVKKNIELAEGEKICIYTYVNPESTRTTGGHNLALQSLLINETVQSTSSNTPATNNQTTAGDATGTPDGTTAPENNANNDDAANKIDPIIIIASVGGALVVIAIVVAVIVGAKKKKK